MKKLIAILIIICLIFVGVAGCSVRENPVPSPAPEASPEVQPTEAPSENDDVENTPPAAKKLDFDAVYAAHEPDEIVLTVGDRDVTWGEYFYVFYSQASQIQEYFDIFGMYYGASISWNDQMGEDSDVTYARYVAQSTGETLRQLQTIRSFAAQNGVELTDEDRANIEEDTRATIASTCGEKATEEDFEEYLAEIYLSREMYDDMNNINYIYQRSFKTLYGENGELFDSEAAVRYLEDSGYISANHILLMTIDPGTYEELSEAEQSEKEALAREIAQELQSIEDKEALLARFAELKEQYCQDTGKTAYPDGYVFTSGTMVREFEDTCSALEAYQVSDPVKSSYGYHVILRLPSDADRVMQYSNEGTPMSARAVAANTEFGNRIQECYDGMELSYAEGFTPPSVNDYLK